MLMGLPDLFLCQRCQRPGSSALNFARHRVSRSNRSCGTQWVGRAGTLGAVHIDTPSFVLLCTESSMLTLHQP